MPPCGVVRQLAYGGPAAAGRGPWPTQLPMPLIVDRASCHHGTCIARRTPTEWSRPPSIDLERCQVNCVTSHPVPLAANTCSHAARQQRSAERTRMRYLGSPRSPTKHRMRAGLSFVPGSRAWKAPALSLQNGTPPRMTLKPIGRGGQVRPRSFACMLASQLALPKSMCATSRVQVALVHPGTPARKGMPEPVPWPRRVLLRLLPL